MNQSKCSICGDVAEYHYFTDNLKGTAVPTMLDPTGYCKKHKGIHLAQMILNILTPDPITLQEVFEILLQTVKPSSAGTGMLEFLGQTVESSSAGTGMLEFFGESWEVGYVDEYKIVQMDVMRAISWLHQNGFVEKHEATYAKRASKWSIV